MHDVVQVRYRAGAMGRMAVRLDQISSTMVRAVVGRRIVGSASAWRDCNDRFCILQSYVRPDYRRRGVARAMYEAVEAASGERLVPAVSLSDDAFEFWKRFRPEAVAQDLRHKREQLVGRALDVRGRRGTVTKASGSVMVVEYQEPEASRSTTCVIVRSIREALEMVGVGA